ncbi:hypothetical protein ACHAAC_03820 [Aeromicrobium sp. CF4.19]|uniref:hypothetical protein n=1 Tax=Aeromicrobium sp. CF4.19 TaxID=3373082 RepID=UPI003EE66190
MRHRLTALTTSAIIGAAGVLAATASSASAASGVVYANYCPFAVTVSSGSVNEGDTIVVGSRRTSPALTYNGAITYRATSNLTGQTIRSGSLADGKGHVVRLCYIAP